MTMPQIRHYEMKDSGVEWIGEMPSHWQIQKAKYYITVTNGSDPVTEGEIPVYGSGSKSFRTCGEYKEGPTVLVGRKGSIDKPRYVTGRYWNVDTAFDVKTKGFDLRLYYYLATCFDYQFYMSQTTLPSMTQTNYRNMFLPVPPLSEQTAIAAYLDEKCATIDAIITEATATIDEYKDWKASVIFEAVTKGLDPNAEMKDSGVEWIGMMPSNWQVKYLFQLVSEVKNKNNDLREKNLLSLSYGKIKRKDIETTDGLLPASFDGYNIIEEGDIVMRLTDLQNDHTSLRVGRATERGIITSAYTTVRPAKETSPFLYLALHSFDVKKGFYGMGAGVRQGLNYGEVKKVLLPFPPANEQQTIVAYLNEKCAVIDSIITEKEALIGELETYKKSLIFETVTGKRRVC